MSKVFKTAPLPFQGQKRRFVGSFALALQELKGKQDIKIIVDLFGGSGLLSYTAKHICPDAKVIYNDFDDYSSRLMNITATNKLLSDIRLIVGYSPREKKLSRELKDTVLQRIKEEEKSGYVDYISLSSNLLFSSNYVVDFKGMRAATLYNNIRCSDYDFNPDEYLSGLEIVSCDYKALYEQYKDMPGVLFIIDPPYLSTDTTTYHSDRYWKLRDYLDVLHVLTGTNYIFFTSDKSSLVELCEWFADNGDMGNPFAGSVLNTHQVSLNKSAGYKDMMLYRFVE